MCATWLQASGWWFWTRLVDGSSQQCVRMIYVRMDFGNQTLVRYMLVWAAGRLAVVGSPLAFSKIQISKLRAQTDELL